MNYNDFGYRRRLYPHRPNFPPATQPCTTNRCSTTVEEFGPDPYVVDITKATLNNPYFRKALWTGTHLQLTLMCIPPGGEVGLEEHSNLDQFLRLEQGQGRVMMGPTETNLPFQRNVADDYAIIIPAGIWHNLVNTGNVPIKLYSLYAPPEHPAGTVHCTMADDEG